ncbi:MAG: hypothetical protein CFE25_02430 [Chitinophagaceae bacterium BSSC1]|nr:MAG: hypothetical protein CFE25_02430 [Chitinophagaceae bacterium BSSC1]
MNPKRMLRTFTVGAGFTLLFAFTQAHQQGGNAKIKMPYKKAGLNTRQAAAHLLSRFSFGARPGEVDALAAMGLEEWLEQQLAGGLNDSAANERLKSMNTLQLSNETIANTYLTPPQVLRLAVRNKLVVRDSVKGQDKPEYREQIRQLMVQQGLKPFVELQTQLINQKIIRAAYGANQLHEVLTDFWFNHFNVSLTKPQCQQFILTFERDAIRPNVTGNFKDMLVATAKHPAMLEYLDNASSISDNNALAKNPRRIQQQQNLNKALEARMGDSSMKNNAIAQQLVNAKRVQGLNENYAREVMELHTLGVDGGYTQKDVTEVARALTGWAVKPLLDDGPGKRLLDKTNLDQMQKRGFVLENDFIFRADKHDEGEKWILGKRFDGKGGYQEGMEVLDMLSRQKATAKFISKKLATRFVSDQPSDALVQKMADRFLKTDGNIKEVLITMVESVEFWQTDALREKIKSPFELVISAVRSTNADLKQPFQVFNWCSRMGQRFYYYQAPTGFPDKASFWINTGSLLNRMNFGLAFATGKIPGISINLLALNQNHEPESAEAALKTYSQLLLPERNQEENIKRLTAMLADKSVADKIEAASAKHPGEASMEETDAMSTNKNLNNRQQQKNDRNAMNRKDKPFTMAYQNGNNNTVSQVAGVIIGSPEFQRK